MQNKTLWDIALSFRNMSYDICSWVLTRSCHVEVHNSFPKLLTLDVKLNYVVSYWNQCKTRKLWLGLYRIVHGSEITAFKESFAFKNNLQDDVLKRKHFPRYWPFVRGIHRSPVNSPHKVQWSVALMFSLICAYINGWVNNRKAEHLRRHCAHYDDTVMHTNLFRVTTFRSQLQLQSLIFTAPSWEKK